MKINTIKAKLTKTIITSLSLERIGNHKYKSQWGIVKTYYKNDCLWVTLLDSKVAISLEGREDLEEYAEDCVKQLIPYDIIKESIQYKIF